MSTSRFPVSFPTLSNESLTLRELSEIDIPPWFARATDAESADLAGDPIPDSIEAGQAWLQRQKNHFTSGTELRWAVVPNGHPISVGTVGLSIIAEVQDTAALGIVIARSHWGMGIGSAATRLAVSYGLSKLGLAEVRAEVLQRNAASRRMLAKAGFHMVRTLPPSAAEPEVMVLYSRTREAQSAA